jgi:NADH pyrophosphatase NudC (nudix superfamily)
MDDLISRQAVLDLPRNTIRSFRGEFVKETISVADIERLPSARKTGKWVDIPHTFLCKCSECGWINDHDSGFKWCPDCGTDMRGGDSE